VQGINAGKPKLPVADEPIEKGHAAPGRAAMEERWRDRVALQAMLLPAVQARRVFARSSFPKSMPCNSLSRPPAMHRSEELFKA
jgi:hypothetical protein